MMLNAAEVLGQLFTGKRVKRPVRSREEYLALRNSVEQQAISCWKKQRESLGKCKNLIM